MPKKNPHIGSSFESWLDEEGFRYEVTTAALHAVIAHQPAPITKKNMKSKKQVAKLRHQNGNH